MGLRVYMGHLVYIEHLVVAGALCRSHIGQLPLQVVLQVLHAVEGDLELEGAGEGRRVVQHHYVVDLDLRHGGASKVPGSETEVRIEFHFPFAKLFGLNPPLKLPSLAAQFESSAPAAFTGLTVRL